MNTKTILSLAASLALGSGHIGAATTPVPGLLKAKYYGQFSELPVGAVQPRGWLQQWLKRQADGLTGHPENLCYPYDTCLYAGLIPPPAVTNKSWKAWWPYEQSAYFVDGTVRLSHLIDDPGIRARRDANIAFMLEHSSGTNLGGSTACWPNAVIGRALLAEFSATGDARAVSVLQNWLVTSAGEIAKGGRNGVNAEEALHLYGLTGDARLLELGRKVCAGYLTATNSFFTTAKILDDAPFHEHGVSAAEELKVLPLLYCYTGDTNLLELAGRAYAKVVQHCLMPDGSFVSSEHLEKTKFYSVHESCDITDWSWSLGYLFMATGDAQVADLIERATFNALPGAVTKDFKQLQYFSAANQLTIGPTNSRTQGHWSTRMTYRAAHDTECCSGNINRAMPNYVIRMWMRSADGGLATVSYGPSELSTTVAGQTVRITEETDYPFRDTVTFRVSTAKATSAVKFAWQFRIPSWCQGATIQVNGRTVTDRPAAGTFSVLDRPFKDGDVVTVKLPMPVKVEDWLDEKSAVVTRGPLVFSLQPTERRVEHTSDPANIKPLLSGRDIRGFPAVEFYATSDWRFGLGPKPVPTKKERKDAKQGDKRFTAVESPMTDNPFAVGQAPIRLEASLYPLPRWDAGKDEPAGLPASLSPGKPATMTLVPYGATHLRLTTLPVVGAD